MRPHPRSEVVAADPGIRWRTRIGRRDNSPLTRHAGDPVVEVPRGEKGGLTSGNGWGGVDSNHRPADYESAEPGFATCGNTRKRASSCGFAAGHVGLFPVVSGALAAPMRPRERGSELSRSPLSPSPDARSSQLHVPRSVVPYPYRRMMCPLTSSGVRPRWRAPTAAAYSSASVREPHRTSASMVSRPSRNAATTQW